jgi:hypothetical protein
VDRRHRDAPVHDGVVVGAGHGDPRRRRPPDPVVRDAARVQPLDELVLVHAPPHAGHLEPLALVDGHRGHVHAQELAPPQAVLQHVPGHDRRRHRRQREVHVLVVLLRDREGRAAVDHGLHRGETVPGVMYHPGWRVVHFDDEIEGDSNPAAGHAVGGRAVDGIAHRPSPTRSRTRSGRIIVFCGRLVDGVRRDDCDADRSRPLEAAAPHRCVVVGHQIRGRAVSPVGRPCAATRGATVPRPARHPSTSRRPVRPVGLSGRWRRLVRVGHRYPPA